MVPPVIFNVEFDHNPIPVGPFTTPPEIDTVTLLADDEVEIATSVLSINPPCTIKLELVPATDTPHAPFIVAPSWITNSLA